MVVVAAAGGRVAAAAGRVVAFAQVVAAAAQVVVAQVVVELAVAGRAVVVLTAVQRGLVLSQCSVVYWDEKKYC